MTAFPLADDVYYPESDGAPMGETGPHIVELMNLLLSLRSHFLERPDVYVIGNMFFYYEKGNPRAVLCPDILVAKGVPSGDGRRRTYKLWEVEVPPCLVIELTSDDTYREDLHSKKDRYAQLGVEDYLLFDPWGDILSPPLQGFRLVDGRYQRIEPAADGSIESRSTGVRFRAEGHGLYAFDMATGNLLPRMELVGEKVAEAAEEKARRMEAEARVAALEKELERLRHQ